LPPEVALKQAVHGSKRILLTINRKRGGEVMKQPLREESYEKNI